MTTYQYDYRTLAGQVYDQGQLGTCAENAEAAVINMLNHQLGLPEYDISRLQSYYDYRAANGPAAINTDTGTNIPAMLRNSETIGLAPESDWVYDISKFTQKPSDQAYTDAASHKILSFFDIHEPYAMNSNVFRDMVKSWLDQGKFPIIGFTVKTWYTQEHGPIGALNPANSAADQGFGGHAGVIVGADDNLCGGAGGYIVRNSWGTGYGDNGDMVIPYSEFPGIVLNSSTGQYNIITFDVITGWMGKDLTWSSERKIVSNLYVELFGRAADIAGLDYWSGQYKGGMSLAAIAQTFNQSPEFTATFGSLTTSQKIDQLYVNAFGHHADTAGLNYWSGQVTDAASLAQTEQNIINGAQGSDITALANKNDVSMYFAASSQLNDLTEAHHVMNFNPLDSAAMQAEKMGIPHDMGWV
jgi:hypothetical protein